MLTVPIQPGAAVLDAAIGMALGAGIPLRLNGPLTGADLDVALAALQLSDPELAPTARIALSSGQPIDLRLPRPRAGAHVLECRSPGAAARALWTLSWPLALLGRPSQLHLRGPNAVPGFPTFHELQSGWRAAAERFGLGVRLELLEAGAESDEGEVVAHLDPAPALTPLHLVHRGLLRQVSLVAGVSGVTQEFGLEAAHQASRELRRQGLGAEIKRVPLPVQGARGLWTLCAQLEFEQTVVAFSELGTPGAGERVAARVARFLSRRAALDAATAERMLLPAILCAAGLGARAGPPPGCHFSTAEVTDGLLQLATIARTALPVRAVVDGSAGDEGVVVVTPA